jgi:hypothetical protein
MSIVVPFSSSSGSTFTTPTAQDIIDEVSQDLRQVLASSSADATILLSYINRVQLEILRDTKWPWMLSAPQRFITQAGQTDYWFGALGSGGQYVVDTGLNLTDVDYVKSDMVFDRTNNCRLAQAYEPPIETQYALADGTPRLGQPNEFRHDRPSAPSVLSIYPAPANTSTYQIVPSNPICTSTTSGALAARTYFVKVSWVDSAGNEGLASSASKIYIPANKVLVVQSPARPITATAQGTTIPSYRVYAGLVEGSETLQSTTSQSNAFTEPGTGLVAGAALPSTNAIDSLGGYIIEFRYYKQREQVTNLNQHLLIPIDYKDVVIAGVNALGYVYLKMYQDAQFWRGEYIEGQRGMIRDKNQFPKSGSDFLQPDLVPTTRTRNN